MRLCIFVIYVCMYMCMYVCGTGLVARLTNVVESEFAQITYTEAVALLQKEIKDKKVCMYVCMYICMYMLSTFIHAPLKYLYR